MLVAIHIAFVGYEVAGGLTITVFGCTFHSGAWTFLAVMYQLVLHLDHISNLWHAVLQVTFVQRLHDGRGAVSCATLCRCCNHSVCCRSCEHSEDSLLQLVDQVQGRLLLGGSSF